MNYDWYLIFNLDEFLATGLVSRTRTVELEGIGESDFLITKGFSVSLTYLDTILPIEFEGRNPYVRSPYAVRKEENGDVYFGVEVEE